MTGPLGAHHVGRAPKLNGTDPQQPSPPLSVEHPPSGLSTVSLSRLIRSEARLPSCMLEEVDEELAMCGAGTNVRRCRWSGLLDPRSVGQNLAVIRPFLSPGGRTIHGGGSVGEKRCTAMERVLSICAQLSSTNSTSLHSKFRSAPLPSTNLLDKGRKPPACLIRGHTSQTSPGVEHTPRYELKARWRLLVCVPRRAGRPIHRLLKERIHRQLRRDGCALDELLIRSQKDHGLLKVTTLLAFRRTCR